MTRWLKQSTSVDLPIGPFLDETDGRTAETALTITQPDIRLKKNGGNWAQKNAAQTLSHEENGYYEVTLDATDTATLGLLRLAVNEAGALPIWEEFLVVPANVWDSLFGADLFDVSVTQIVGAAVSTTTAQLGVNVVQVSGDGTAADNLETAFDDTAGAVRWSQIIDQGTAQAVTGTTIRLRSAAAFADDELNGSLVLITGGTLGIGQVRQITDYVSSTDTATVDTWTTTPTGTVTYQVLPSSALTALSAAAIRAAVGMASANLDTQLGAVATQALLTTVAGYLDTEITAIYNKVVNLPTDPADQSILAGLIAAITAPSANDNADALLDRVAGVETNLTVRQALRLFAAVLLGKASGMDSTTAIFRDTNDTTNRIEATVDAFGNRTAVTRDAS